MENNWTKKSITGSSLFFGRRQVTSGEREEREREKREEREERERERTEKTKSLRDDEVGVNKRREKK